MESKCVVFYNVTIVNCYIIMVHLINSKISNILYVIYIYCYLLYNRKADYSFGAILYSKFTEVKLQCHHVLNHAVREGPSYT